jgi:hypothetical protein
MNNILTFEDYKKMNIRQVESVIYRQFIEENIKDESEVNEGFIRKAINKASGKFIQTALGEEIEKGKELERSIKEALDGLDRGFNAIAQRINNGGSRNSRNSRNSNVSLQAIEQVKDAIKAVQSQTFDTLTMIGSEGEIDFAGFMGSASVAAAANFGILFSPIRSLFMTRKAYKYFLGIIKQTIRRNLLVIQLNFDQFENLILQKSFENEDGEANARREAIEEVINKMSGYLLGPNSKDGITGSRNVKKIKDTFDAYLKYQKANDAYMKSSPFSSLWQDQHNNTYTRTLEQIKQYINDDSQKELDALKNSITKIAGSDTELAQYGELLISAAEEYAVKTNHGINNNFIKMSSVFNLENQKKLIELITETQKENEEEAKRLKAKHDLKVQKRNLKKSIKRGKKLYNDKFKSLPGTVTYKEFEEKYSEDIKDLSAYLLSDEGENDRDDFIGKNPMYKYFINDIKNLNTFLDALYSLKIVKVTDIDSFVDNFVDTEHALYYLQAEKSIKYAVESNEQTKYFGIKELNKYHIDNRTHKLGCNQTKKDEILKNIFGTNTVSGNRANTNTNKEKYFLTFETPGDDLFDILHKDFKTEIFKSTDDTYEENISYESKEAIVKIIEKNFNIGNNILPQFAKYLVRLEAHMLLTDQIPWFVLKKYDDLKGCFKRDSDKIKNKHAFVEIKKDDYEKINSFLTKYDDLYENDFITESNNDEENEN